MTSWGSVPMWLLATKGLTSLPRKWCHIEHSVLSLPLVYWHSTLALNSDCYPCCEIHIHNFNLRPSCKGHFVHKSMTRERGWLTSTEQTILCTWLVRDSFTRKPACDHSHEHKYCHALCPFWDSSSHVCLPQHSLSFAPQIYFPWPSGRTISCYP